MHPRSLRVFPRIVIRLSLAAVAASLWLCPSYATGSTADRIQPVVPMKAAPFELKDVRLLDGPFRQALLRDQAYLVRLDADRLLHMFRLTAGLPSTAQPYGGWEEPKCEVRGHSLGHYLSACALMYASTGDQGIKAKADYIVAELAKCQDALPKQGYHPGYLSAFPESFIDRVEARQPVWAPWYTLHKIMAGLLDMYQLADNQQALAVLQRMAGWVRFRVDRLTPAQMQAALETEFGGMNDVLANLYAVTGNPDHLRLARAFDHERVFAPLARGEDRLDGLHANTQIPKIIGAAREYELTGDQRCQGIAAFFWQRVALNRSYVIGGHSDGEHFFPIDQFSRHLTAETAETCNTYNMLKLTRHLFAWNPSSQTMDFYERGLYNHILASQDPVRGMFVYLTSLKPGHFKTYSTPDNSFWCCVGTGMENHAKYGDTIYFHDQNSLFVNLFIPSELTWKEHGLVIRQETKFPAEDTTRLTLKCAQPLAGSLKIRYPGWAQSGVVIKINGQGQNVAGVPGSYLDLNREWHDGDQVDIRFPLTLHIETLPDNPNLVAILYGPIVLAGDLGTKDLPNPYTRDQTDLNHVPSPAAPAFVTEARNWLERVQPVRGKPLTFRTKGLGRPKDVTLIPFYQTHHQRYSVYWPVFTPLAWKQKASALAAADVRRRTMERRTVDVVHPGQPQSETDHRYRGEQSQTGDFNGRKWRHAPSAGWFRYELAVAKDRPINLVCTYWGSDAGNRVFDVVVDGVKIATQKLDHNRPGEFYDEIYPLPADVTRGKERVTVEFRAQPDNLAGGLYDLRTLRR